MLMAMDVHQTAQVDFIKYIQGFVCQPYLDKVFFFFKELSEKEYAARNIMRFASLEVTNCLPQRWRRRCLTSHPIARFRKCQSQRLARGLGLTFRCCCLRDPSPASLTSAQLL